MKFKHGDTVRVLEGFYREKSGEVIEHKTAGGLVSLKRNIYEVYLRSISKFIWFSENEIEKVKK